MPSVTTTAGKHQHWGWKENYPRAPLWGLPSSQVKGSQHFFHLLPETSASFIEIGNRKMVHWGGSCTTANPAKMQAAHRQPSRPSFKFSCCLGTVTKHAGRSGWSLQVQPLWPSRPILDPGLTLHVYLNLHLARGLGISPLCTWQTLPGKGKN